MKVTQTDDKRVLIELETTDEAVALWAVSAHVGGNQPALRQCFSRTPDSSSPGLYELLTPLVRRHFDASRANDLQVHSLLHGHFKTQLSGRLDFKNVSSNGD